MLIRCHVLPPVRAGVVGALLLAVLDPRLASAAPNAGLGFVAATRGPAWSGTVTSNRRHAPGDAWLALWNFMPAARGAGWLEPVPAPGDEAPEPADGSPYTLLVSGQEGVDPVHVETMRSTFFSVYPQLAARFNPAAPSVVGMIFTDEPGVAWASDGNTFYNKSYLASAPLDSDVVVHETMHIVQGGYSGEVPGWIIEGTADYVRDAYGLHNAEHGWALPTGWTYGPHYLDGYGDAAAFMKWIDATHRRGRQPVADALDDILRQGLYSDQTFIDLTGQDVESLWLEYSAGEAPVSDDAGVSLFQDASFSGRAFTLAPGLYDALDLRARGLNDSTSSLVVPDGYIVSVFADSFAGASAVYTGDIDFVGDTLNDQISSLLAEAIEVD